MTCCVTLSPLLLLFEPRVTISATSGLETVSKDHFIAICYNVEVHRITRVAQLSTLGPGSVPLYLLRLMELPYCTSENSYPQLPASDASSFPDLTFKPLPSLPSTSPSCLISCAWRLTPLLPPASSLHLKVFFRLL